MGQRRAAVTHTGRLSEKERLVIVVQLPGFLSLLSSSMSLSSFFFFLFPCDLFLFFLIPHNFIFSHFFPLFISHFPFLISSLAMQFNLIAKLTWFCLHGANVLKHVTVLCQPCICLMGIQTPQFGTFTSARVRTPLLK